MGDVVYRSHVEVERAGGPLRYARVSAEEAQVVFGVHSEVAAQYGHTEGPVARSAHQTTRRMELRETALTLSLRQAARMPGSPRGPSGPAGRSWEWPSTIRSTRSL